MTLVIALSNRRDLYLPDALASLQQHVTGWDQLIVVDDSGDQAWREELATAHRITVVGDEPAGYTRAMQTVWNVARLFGDRFLFLEEDFRFVRPIDVHELHATLDDNGHLAQIALRRAPWYRREKQIGVLAAQHERVDRERRNVDRAFTNWIEHQPQRVTSWIGDRIRSIPGYVEHDAGITGNPSLWSADALQHDWPDVEWSETAMGDKLHASGLTSGWLGTMHQTEYDVEHIGAERAEHSQGY